MYQKFLYLLLQLQQAGKRKPECFSPKNMNDCDTPLEEGKDILFEIAIVPTSIPIYHYYILPGIRHKEMMDKMN